MFHNVLSYSTPIFVFLDPAVYFPQCLLLLVTVGFIDDSLCQHSFGTHFTLQLFLILLSS